MKCIIITPYAGARIADLPDDHDKRYETLRQIVGGYIELVRPPFAGTAAYINEEGKLLDLDVNEVATDLMRPNLFPSDDIAGSMVIVGDDGSGDEVGLTNDQIVALMFATSGTRWPFRWDKESA